jgi:broad specificity phosphatase PhoE
MEKKNKKLVVIRHGQSIGNIARDESFKRSNDSFYFDPNFMDLNPDHWELTELGKEQSKKAGEFLRQVLLLNPGEYISSNTARTRQTAGYVFPDAILNINEPLVKERAFAGHDKITKSDWQSRLSSAGLSEVEDSYEWKVPGGESASDMEVRLKSFLNKLGEVVSDHDETFIFTHGDLIQVLRVILHKIDAEKYVQFKQLDSNYVRNCQIFIFELDPDAMALISEKTYFYENGVWKEGQYVQNDGIMQVKELDK